MAAPHAAEPARRGGLNRQTVRTGFAKASLNLLRTRSADCGTPPGNARRGVQSVSDSHAIAFWERALMKSVLHGAVRRSMAVAIRRALVGSAIVALSGMATVHAQETTRPRAGLAAAEGSHDAGYRVGAGQPHQAAHRGLLGGADRHPERRGIPERAVRRHARQAAHAGALVRRQHHPDRRRRHAGPPGHPARPAAGQHPGAGQRQAPPPRRGDHLPRPWRGRWLAGPGHLGAPVDGAGAGRSAA